MEGLTCDWDGYGRLNMVGSEAFDTTGSHILVNVFSTSADIVSITS